MKNDNLSFARTPVASARVSEKPFTSWSSGKIKRIYDSYELFVQEIGKLLDGPVGQSKKSTNESEEMIEEFEAFWQNTNPFENAKQLMTILSPFFKAGLILKSTDEKTKVEGFFAESSSVLSNLLDMEIDRITPPLASESEALKPSVLESLPIIQKLGLQGLDWKEDSMAFHFWLDSESKLSLLLLSESAEPHRRQLVLKTQALIQRRFYD